MLGAPGTKGFIQELILTSAKPARWGHMASDGLGSCRLVSPMPKPPFLTVTLSVCLIKENGDDSNIEVPA